VTNSKASCVKILRPFSFHVIATLLLVLLIATFASAGHSLSWRLFAALLSVACVSWYLILFFRRKPGEREGSAGRTEMGRRFASLLAVLSLFPAGYAAYDLLQVARNRDEAASGRQLGDGGGAAQREVSLAIEMKLLPAGSFLMGEVSKRRQISEPFLLGTYPVTQGEYERVMEATPSKFKGNDRRPVEQVSWFDAIEFCNRLSKLEELPPYYKVVGTDVTILGGLGYRLPTEAEWEYACRAGSEGAYCFGDDEKQLKQYAWFYENSGGTTHRVGEKQPNDWGLYDMHGNVWEWCWDWYFEGGGSDGSFRVLRGGSWWSLAWPCRSAVRGWYDPEYRGSDLGFRLARSSVRQEQPVSGAESGG